MSTVLTQEEIQEEGGFKKNLKSINFFCFFTLLVDKEVHKSVGIYVFLPLVNILVYTKRQKALHADSKHKTTRRPFLGLKMQK